MRMYIDELQDKYDACEHNPGELAMLSNIEYYKNNEIIAISNNIETIDISTYDKLENRIYDLLDITIDTGISNNSEYIRLRIYNNKRNELYSTEIYPAYKASTNEETHDMYYLDIYRDAYEIISIIISNM